MDSRSYTERMPRRRAATHVELLEADVAELEQDVAAIERDVESQEGVDKPMLNTDELLAQLNNSGSATIYVDIAGISHDTTVSGGVHVEFDEVRQLFAVRRATAEEVVEAEAETAAV